MTPEVLQRRRHRLALKKKRLQKRKSAEADYAKLLAQRKKESKVRYNGAKSVHDDKLIENSQYHITIIIYGKSYWTVKVKAASYPSTFY